MIVDIKKQVFELLCEIANKYGNGDYSGYGCPIVLYKDENGDAYFGILSPDIYKDDWYVKTSQKIQYGIVFVMYKILIFHYEIENKSICKNGRG